MLWRLILACRPEPDVGECPETCDVSLEIVPPSGLTGVLTVRSDPPGYSFGGELRDPSGAEIWPVNGLSEADVELLPGDLVAGETYTLAMSYACEPGEGKRSCRELDATFVAAGAGTGPTATTITTTPTDVTDVLVQAPVPKSDVLFVVDNSCSMSDEQYDLVNAFPSFLSFFLGSGLDYHIGVVSTDIDGSYNGSKGKLREVNGDRWIDDGTSDPFATFNAMASMGTSGSGNEKGLGAAYDALEIYRDTANEGFLRDDSGLHVIVVSDEPDYTPANVITQPEFVEWFDSLRADSDDRTFSSIVDLQTGTRYTNTTLEIGGVVWDIADDDYIEVLERLGLQAAGLKREFFLSRVPDPDTLEVSVNDPIGATLEFTQDEDYSYEPGRNSVQFLTYIPVSGSEIVVHYVPAD